VPEGIAKVAFPMHNQVSVIPDMRRALIARFVNPSMAGKLCKRDDDFLFIRRFAHWIASKHQRTECAQFTKIS